MSTSSSFTPGLKEQGDQAWTEFEKSLEVLLKYKRDEDTHSTASKSQRSLSKSNTPYQSPQQSPVQHVPNTYPRVYQSHPPPRHGPPPPPPPQLPPVQGAGSVQQYQSGPGSQEKTSAHSQLIQNPAFSQRNPPPIPQIHHQVAKSQHQAVAHQRQHVLAQHHSHHPQQQQHQHHQRLIHQHQPPPTLPACSQYQVPPQSYLKPGTHTASSTGHLPYTVHSNLQQNSVTNISTSVMNTSASAASIKYDPSLMLSPPAATTRPPVSPVVNQSQNSPQIQVSVGNVGQSYSMTHSTTAQRRMLFSPESSNVSSQIVSSPLILSTPPPQIQFHSSMPVYLPMQNMSDKSASSSHDKAVIQPLNHMTRHHPMCQLQDKLRSKFGVCYCNSLPSQIPAQEENTMSVNPLALFQCAGCGIKLEDYSEMESHVEKKHVGNDSVLVKASIVVPNNLEYLKVHQCGIRSCNKRFVAQPESSLKKHIRSVHGEYYVHMGMGRNILRICRICTDNSSFSCDLQLSEHLLTVHPTSIYANAECKDILPDSQNPLVLSPRQTHWADNEIQADRFVEQCRRERSRSPYAYYSTPVSSRPIINKKDGYVDERHHRRSPTPGRGYSRSPTSRWSSSSMSRRSRRNTPSPTFRKRRFSLRSSMSRSPTRFRTRSACSPTTSLGYRRSRSRSVDAECRRENPCSYHDVAVNTNQLDGDDEDTCEALRRSLLEHQQKHQEKTSSASRELNNNLMECDDLSPAVNLPLPALPVSVTAISRVPDNQAEVAELHRNTEIKLRTRSKECYDINIAGIKGQPRTGSANDIDGRGGETSLENENAASTATDSAQGKRRFPDNERGVSGERSVPLRNFEVYSVGRHELVKDDDNCRQERGISKTDDDTRSRKMLPSTSKVVNNEQKPSTSFEEHSKNSCSSQGQRKKDSQDREEHSEDNETDCNDNTAPAHKKRKVQDRSDSKQYNEARTYSKDKEGERSIESSEVGDKEKEDESKKKKKKKKGNKRRKNSSSSDSNEEEHISRKKKKSKRVTKTVTKHKKKKKKKDRREEENKEETRSLKVYCSACESYTHDWNLHKYLYRHIRNDKKARCLFCPARVWFPQLKNHVKETHRGASFVCNASQTCFIRLMDLAKIVDHINTKHRKELEPLHKLTGQSGFVSPHLLAKHGLMILPADLKKLTCRLCNLYWLGQDKSALEGHFAQEHPNIKKCDIESNLLFECRGCDGLLFGSQLYMMKHFKEIHALGGFKPGPADLSEDELFNSHFLHNKFETDARKLIERNHEKLNLEDGSPLLIKHRRRSFTPSPKPSIKSRLGVREDVGLNESPQFRSCGSSAKICQVSDLANRIRKLPAKSVDNATSKVQENRETGWICETAGSSKLHHNIQVNKTDVEYGPSLADVRKVGSSGDSKSTDRDQYQLPVKPGSSVMNLTPTKREPCLFCDKSVPAPRLEMHQEMKHQDLMFQCAYPQCQANDSPNSGEEKCDGQPVQSPWKSEIITHIRIKHNRNEGDELLARNFVKMPINLQMIICKVQECDCAVYLGRSPGKVKLEMEDHVIRDHPTLSLSACFSLACRGCGYTLSLDQEEEWLSHTSKDHRLPGVAKRIRAISGSSIEYKAEVEETKQTDGANDEDAQPVDGNHKSAEQTENEISEDSLEIIQKDQNDASDSPTEITEETKVAGEMCDEAPRNALQEQIVTDTSEGEKKDEDEEINQEKSEEEIEDKEKENFAVESIS